MNERASEHGLHLQWYCSNLLLNFHSVPRLVDTKCATKTVDDACTNVHKLNLQAVQTREH